MGQQHDFYLVQSGNLVPRAALWRGFLACFQQPSLLRPANLDSSDYLLRWESPATLKFVRDSWGFGGGIFAGAAIFLISRFAQSTRLGMKSEFEQMTLLYGRIR